MSDPFLERAFAGLPIDCCSIIDAHGHLGACPLFPVPDISLDTVLRSMDRLGIDLFAVSSMPALFGDAARGNRIVEDAIRAYPDRFFGYMAVDIGYPERILPELTRCLEAGFHGVKVWSQYDSALPYDHENYLPVYEFAAAHRLPVLAHTWGRELEQLEPSIRRHPQINWLLAHACSQDQDQYLRLARSYPNVYLELCFSRAPRGLIEELVRNGLVDKMIWGSDAIFMSAEQQLGRVVFAQISPENKAKILGGNAQRALRLL